MKIIICEKEYKLKEKTSNLLEAFIYIKTTQNNALTFKSGCRSGICGNCAVVVNGVERLACKTTIKDEVEVKPLKNLKVIKDLVVDNSCQNRLLKKAKAQLEQKSNEVILPDNVSKIDKESNCILCNICYSSCPVYAVNKDFIGPFAMARAYRYIEDKKETNIKNKIGSLQDNGVWSCTLCGNCSMVCPSLIDIKTDIMMLQNKSVQYGYQNPNLTSGFDTGIDFGFNP
jgi:fumarate reductase iron-sulfur subunit